MHNLSLLLCFYLFFGTFYEVSAQKNKNAIRINITTKKQKLYRKDSVLVHWNVKGLDKQKLILSIYGLANNLPETGQKMLLMDGKTAYRFLVKNKKNKIITQKNFFVAFNKLKINYFGGDTVQNYKETVTLNWDVESATRVRIVGISDSLPERGSIEVPADNSRNFILEAYNDTPTPIQMEHHLRVRFNAKLDMLTKAYPDDTIKISWKVETKKIRRLKFYWKKNTPNEGWREYPLPPPDSTGKQKIVMLPGNLSVFHTYIQTKDDYISSERQPHTMDFKLVIDYRDGTEETLQSTLTEIIPTLRLNYVGRSYNRWSSEHHTSELYGSHTKFQWSSLGLTNLKITNGNALQRSGVMDLLVLEDSYTEITAEDKWGHKYRGAVVIKVLQNNTPVALKTVSIQKVKRDEALFFKNIGADYSKYPNEIKLKISVTDKHSNFITHLEDSTNLYFKTLAEVANNQVRSIKKFEIKRHNDKNVLKNAAAIIATSHNAQADIDLVAKIFMADTTCMASVVYANSKTLKIVHKVTDKSKILPEFTSSKELNIPYLASISLAIKSLDTCNVGAKQVILLFSNTRLDRNFDRNTDVCSLLFWDIAKKQNYDDLVAEMLQKNIQLIILHKYEHYSSSDNFGRNYIPTYLSRLTNITGGFIYNFGTPEASSADHEIKLMPKNLSEVAATARNLQKNYYELTYKPELRTVGGYSAKMNVKSLTAKDSLMMFLGDRASFLTLSSSSDAGAWIDATMKQTGKKAVTNWQYCYENDKVLLNKYVAYLKKNMNNTVCITGFNSASSNAECRENKHVRRALAIKKYFVANGIDASRVLVYQEELILEQAANNITIFVGNVCAQKPTKNDNSDEIELLFLE